MHVLANKVNGTEVNIERRGVGCITLLSDAVMSHHLVALPFHSGLTLQDLSYDVWMLKCFAGCYNICENAMLGFAALK